MRLAAGCATAAVLGAFVFPLAAYWSWGGGWLAQLGVNFGLGAGFIDAGGAGTVHLLGGLSAMAVIWIAGPRRGKFPKEGFSTAMPGHNAVYVLFGCLICLVGWMAFNLAGAILWLDAPMSALPLTAINTLLSASTALASHIHRYAHSLRQAGRKPLREWLDVRAGGVERVRGDCHADRGTFCGAGGGYRNSAAGGVV